MKTGTNFGWLAALLLTLPTISPALHIAIGGYPLPSQSGGTYPSVIAVGPDHALWFTETAANKIGRITPAAVITAYSVPTPNCQLGGITAGPDGALWFTESFGNKIGRITTAGKITEYPLSTANNAPQGITAGPDGALWFAYPGSTQPLSPDYIGRIPPAGVITEYPLPIFNSYPIEITEGPDGALWFTEANGNNIGRITTAGVIMEYPIPTAKSQPYGITAGPDGALWFTARALSNGQIGRITTGGVVTLYPVPTATGSPSGITAGPDGALWFTESLGNKIGRITTAGTITEYAVPSAVSNSGPTWIAAEPHRALWFTENLGNQIGEAVFVTAGLSVSPASGSYQTNLTFTGSTFAPNENVQIYQRGIGSGVLASAHADADGSFTVSAGESQSSFGPRLFLAVGQSSGKVAAASFSVTPRLVLKPKSGPVGTTITAEGYGFGPGDRTLISWGHEYNIVGGGNANILGAFTSTFTVPGGSPLGMNAVQAVGSLPGPDVANTYFTVQ